MTRTIAAVTALAMLGGCALVPFRHHHAAAKPDRPGTATVVPGQAATLEGGACNVDMLKVLLGRPGSAVLAAQALDLAHARTIRWLHSGDMATMDFSPDRLNIRLTRANVVKSFSCG